MFENLVQISPFSSTILIAVLAALSISGIVLAFIGGGVLGDDRREQRLNAITARSQPVLTSRGQKDSEKRRRSVQDQLKEMESRNKNKDSYRTNPPLDMLMEQAGLSWEKKHFIYFSLISSLVGFLVGIFLIKNIWISILLLVFSGLIFPKAFVKFKRKKRFSKFLDELPSAVDIVIRGVKAGMPVAECIKVVANEANEPVASEFQQIVEMQLMGVSLSDSVSRLPERVPLPEANFFSIVIGVQQKAGGSLADALSNLSKVLRQRKSIQRKIKALSSEAISSAGIIGSLPILVGSALYLIAPDYIGLLFSERIGNFILIGGMLWMLAGILVMRKMISFDI